MNFATVVASSSTCTLSLPYHTCAACGGRTRTWGAFRASSGAQNSETSVPPSLTRSHPPRPRHDTWPAGVHARALSSCPSVGWAGSVHPTRSQVPRHEPPSRRDDARRPRRLGFRSIPCWAGPRPHTWWANICSPAREEREGRGPATWTTTTSAVMPSASCAAHAPPTPPSATGAPSSPRWRSPPAPPSQAPR